MPGGSLGRDVAHASGLRMVGKKARREVSKIMGEAEVLSGDELKDEEFDEDEFSGLEEED